MWAMVMRGTRGHSRGRGAMGVPALCDERINVIIAAGVCIVVCIYLFDVLGEFIISDRRWRWSVAESSVENKKARATASENGPDM